MIVLIKQRASLLTLPGKSFNLFIIKIKMVTGKLYNRKIIHLMLRGVGDTLKKKPDSFLLTFTLGIVKTLGGIKIKNIVPNHIS